MWAAGLCVEGNPTDRTQQQEQTRDSQCGKRLEAPEHDMQLTRVTENAKQMTHHR